MKMDSASEFGSYSNLLSMTIEWLAGPFPTWGQLTKRKKTYAKERSEQLLAPGAYQAGCMIPVAYS
jgi:hypothetical protein